ncbi:hypothetical protein QQ054_32885 [Oscillatoria amoena NRMC-F 0135]|nr:hypothetical protein [Oscillatoria amoena NRMC-F 0135]
MQRIRMGVASGTTGEGPGVKKNLCFAVGEKVNSRVGKSVGRRAGYGPLSQRVQSEAVCFIKGVV